MRIASIFIVAAICSSNANGQTQLIRNGTFSGSVSSSDWSRIGNFFADSRFDRCRSCPGYAYVSNPDGSAGNDLGGILYQVFTVPQGANSIQLTYWTYNTSDDAGRGLRDQMAVSILNSSFQVVRSIATHTNLTTSAGYVQHGPFSLNEFAGQDIVLWFAASTDSILPTVFRLDDVSILATIAPTRTLTVASSNPNSGVPITVAPADGNGQASGSTLFTRSYTQNTQVTLTAPSTASGNVFTSWQRNGFYHASTLHTSVTMDSNHTMTAVYTTPPPLRTLTVASSNPSSGVSITVSPADSNGQASGSTQFTRSYTQDTQVTLTAPSAAGGNTFAKWQRDGVDYAFTFQTSVVMDANRTMTAVYSSPACIANLSSPAANAAIIFPQSFTWSTSGSCSNVALGLASSSNPSPSNTWFATGSSGLTVQADAWPYILTVIGSSSTYYWSVGEVSGGTFNARASWRPFTVTPTGSCCVPPPTDCLVTTQDACSAWPWVPGGTCSVNDCPTCFVTLNSPSSNAAIIFPQSFTWSTSGSCSNVALGLASSSNPSQSNIWFALGSSGLTVQAAAWPNILTVVGSSSTYYWTVGEVSAGNFTARASWRPFTVTPTGSCCVPPPTDCLVTTQDACSAWPWVPGGTCSVNDCPTCFVTLNSPSSNAAIIFPQSFTWSTSGSCSNVALGLASSSNPSQSNIWFALGSSGLTVQAAAWPNILTVVGSSSTYYWTVGEVSAGNFTARASWRPFTVTPTGSCCVPPPTDCLITTQDACTAWPWVPGGSCSVSDCSTPTQPYLSVSPTRRDVQAGAGSASYSVWNSGTGTMNWTSSVISGQSWLWRTSGLAGTNSGLVTAGFSANVAATARTGVIRVLAPGATPPFVDVSVVQAGTDPGPTVTHFDFDPITGPYQVNEPIPVTIRAMAGASLATGANMRVYLTAAPVSVPSRSFVDLAGGTWSGDVALDAAGTGIRLRASAGGLTGVSNEFEMQAPSIQPGRIEGHVTIGNAPALPVPGANVHLEGAALRITFANSEGHYSFSEVAPGAYTLIAYQGSEESERRDVRVRAGATITENLHVRLSKQAVLLVAGIMGSTQKSAPLGGFPSLGVRGVSQDELTLYDPACYGIDALNVDTWRSLRGLLDDYFTVYLVPWDWRLPVDRAWREHLLPRIARAKRDPADKVHIVAHSMGGLLSRAYIQSELYDNDVDKLALVGTPNEGAPIAYIVWEGGDLSEADEISGSSFFQRVCEFDGFYTRTGIQAVRDLDLPLPRTNTEWKIFLHAELHSIGDLMPVYPFLNRGSSPFPWRYASLSALHKLNNGVAPYSHPYRLVGHDANRSPEEVYAKLFLTTGEDTLLTLRVGDSSPGDLYSDGAPRWTFFGPPKEADGDGTVPRTSVLAQLPLPSQSDGDNSHAFLLKEYRAEICEFLLGEPCVTSKREGEDLIDEGSALASILSISVSGRVQPYLVDPLGAGSGIEPVTGDLDESISGSSIIVLTDSAGISVNDPIPGTYRLNLTALPGEVFTLDVNYLDAAGVERAAARGIYHDGVVSIDIDASDAPAVPAGREGSTRRGKGSPRDDGQPRVTIRGAVEPPANIRAERVNGLARIVWDASPDATTADYRVYARPEDQPKYTLLGTTTTTQFDTPHPWVVAGQGTSWRYFVTAAEVDGRESLFDTVVENRTPLIARLTAKRTRGVAPMAVQFYDVSAGEVGAWAWDFDSDGVIDSTERNPLHTFDDAGTYTVSLTVGGPEGTDTAIEVGFITVDDLVTPPPPVPSGAPVAWGSNIEGALNVPLDAHDVISIAAGSGHNLALRRDGTIIAWGSNHLGQAQVPYPNSDFVHVAAGGHTSAGLKSDGSFVVWGLVVEPIAPPASSSFVQIAIGWYHFLALDSNGSITAWGCPDWSDFGQCDVPNPNEEFVAVAADGYHSLGLRSDGSIEAWGAGGSGQSGDPHYGQSIIPLDTGGYVAIAAGPRHSLGLKADGSVVAWGCGYPQDFGQCSVPLPNSGFVEIAGGHYHSLGLTADGVVRAWGCGNFYINEGQCAEPALNVGFLGIAAGAKHSVAIRKD